jgi:hypothetical protein
MCVFTPPGGIHTGGNHDRSISLARATSAEKDPATSGVRMNKNPHNLTTVQSNQNNKSRMYNLKLTKAEAAFDSINRNHAFFHANRSLFRCS